MAEVLLYHHVQGLTAGVRAFADELRRAGHTVHTPDLFEGRTFGTLEEGMEFARDRGFDTLWERGAAATENLSPNLVYAGFSFGVTIAQRLAQTRPGARGALLMHACIPVTEYGQSWPDNVPVQIHGKEDDEFFDEDLPAAHDLANSVPTAELFLYSGEQHLFTDSSLASFDEEASKLLLHRVRTFLASL
ncbi:dienelactone hydrolase family protein [Streptomyces sp. 15-116A]|uniref:dienelactone hydrolase family protein n=1 Tax=Streptomyces sp. 15-116A TaxID=2259035 RepID=UPI0021B34432|nr:dienelactone hydrolase family protein [Streptomyces sp. 15-116A]MCT7351351.1 dienelactone hydrolase family protein [Streptomyces sp. 15-116A]